VSANGLERYAAMATLVAPDLYGRVAGPALTGVNDDQLWALRRYWRPELDAVSCCSYVDLRSYLPDDILTKVDRASMRYSLEVRPPLLDTRLVESITRLPVGARFREGEQKPLLRAALGGDVPESVFTSRKQGFSLPLNSWVQERAASSGLVDRLRSGPVCTEGFVRADRLEQLTKPPFSGHHLWAVMVLDGWLRRQ
jgi:asparagine synthase (glutamine-hydrolysing)